MQVISFWLPLPCTEPGWKVPGFAVVNWRHGNGLLGGPDTIMELAKIVSEKLEALEIREKFMADKTIGIPALWLI